jgi:hypothetical protein
MDGQMQDGNGQEFCWWLTWMSHTRQKSVKRMMVNCNGDLLKKMFSAFVAYHFGMNDRWAMFWVMPQKMSLKRPRVAEWVDQKIVMETRLDMTDFRRDPWFFKRQNHMWPMIRDHVQPWVERAEFHRWELMNLILFFCASKGMNKDFLTILFRYINFQVFSSSSVGKEEAWANMGKHGMDQMLLLVPTRDVHCKSDIARQKASPLFWSPAAANLLVLLVAQNPHRKSLAKCLANRN